MNVIEIAHQIAKESAREDLVDDDNIGTVFNWLNRYKLYLQRDKRIAFSENTTTITMRINARTTALPSDYLHPITIRRQRGGETGVTFDAQGRKTTITKDLTLTRWLNRQEFLNNFPVQRAVGELHTGTPNDYCIIGNSIVWGPIPSTDESIYIDYFRIEPEYTLHMIEDDFTKYYFDGLFHRGMMEVFSIWIPDEKKAALWTSRVKESELGLRKYQVSREIPMESEMELPDT